MGFFDERDLNALDHSGRAALLLSAVASGRSYQPNLLTRNTVDQAVITGVSAAAGYGLGISVHSMLARCRAGSAAGAPTWPRWLPWMPPRRPPDWVWPRLCDGASTSLPAVRSASRGRQRGGGGECGIGVDRAGDAPQGAGHGASHARRLSCCGAGSWLYTRPWKQAPGSLVAPGKFFEDDVREVSPMTAGAIGVVVTLLSFGLARGEAALSRGFAHSASFVLGGSPAEHRTLGRVGATAATYGLGWLAVTTVAAKLTRGGEGMEPAHATPPATPEVTGSPASGVAWDTLSREGGVGSAWRSPRRVSTP